MALLWMIENSLWESKELMLPLYKSL